MRIAESDRLRDIQVERNTAASLSLVEAVAPQAADLIQDELVPIYRTGYQVDPQLLTLHPIPGPSGLANFRQIISSPSGAFANAKTPYRRTDRASPATS